MKDETNKIVNWIEMGYTRLNYKEELSLVNYIKQLQEENSRYERINQKYKEAIDKAIKLIEKAKERRILLLLEIEVLDILKEVE